MTIELTPGTHEFMLPDGRKLHLYVQHLPDHAFVDIWTTRGRDVEEISRHTGDTTRAPMGTFAWRNGGRYKLSGDADPDAEILATPESYGWPAVSCVTILWDVTS